MGDRRPSVQPGGRGCSPRKGFLPGFDRKSVWDRPKSFIQLGCSPDQSVRKAGFYCTMLRKNGCKLFYTSKLQIQSKLFKLQEYNHITKGKQAMLRILKCKCMTYNRDGLENPFPLTSLHQC